MSLTASARNRNLTLCRLMEAPKKNQASGHDMEHHADNRTTGSGGKYYLLRSKNTDFAESFSIMHIFTDQQIRDWRCMSEPASTERQLIPCLVNALRELPDVEANLDRREPIGKRGNHRCDALVNLRVAGKSFVLLLETRKTVYPRDVRQVIWQLRAASDERAAGHEEIPLPLIVAESISPGAKELLRSERVGYYDSGGSLYLPAPGVYLYIDKPPPKAMTKSVRTLFSGRRAQVLHTLLVRHEDWFGVTDLAKLAMVSPATTSQVLTELDRFDWLEARGQGPNKERHLREPTALLDEWVKQLATLDAPTLRRYYVPGVKVDTLTAQIGQVFDAHNVQYAMSHEAAAQCYTRFLSSISQVRVRMLVGQNADTALGDLDARVVNEGANLTIIEAKSPGDLLFRERLDGVWLASPAQISPDNGRLIRMPTALWVASSIQIYLDLLRGEGRSKEMAEHFRKERIGF